MRRQLKSVSLKCICAGAALFALAAARADSAAQDKLDALFGAEIVARGDGFEISRTAVDESVVTIRASAAGRGNDISPAALQRIEREVLRRLINIQLLSMRATDEDRAQAVAKSDERIGQLTERAGSQEALDRQLKAVGLSLDRLRAKLIEEATAEVVLQRELDVQITDEQIREYYEDNPARFEHPEMVRAAHILLRTTDPATNKELSEEEKEAKRRQIDLLLERARKGEDFAKLASEYSEDQGSKDNGVEYTFPRGRMVPEFEAAAFALAPGQISDVITTQFGYHIITVREKIPASVVDLDDSVRAEVREFLKAQELQKQMQPFVETLMKEKHVEILDERLKPRAGDNPVPDTAAGAPVP